ncbi:OPT family oligopeptide transporter [Bythopirellula goksoeyrii]|uniref:OPT oligopeptide transporter protein n=1 Tax=Bythopirellula goksoeyrii TaxID=1400387 RepID=A0A5B9QH56_9BACT|nr:OPT family oligopeptide transporter [Bythopirellula goksoeyrii]QEG37269.1 OPT oligopeptide transporter protein [Bythopirellula goksoeyrii]
MPENETVPTVDSDIKYTPQPGERQLTARALIAGCLVGSVVSCTNIYIALKIGWSFGASIITAVLSYSIFSWFNNKLSVMETNIAQTAGSAAGYMSTAAGLVAPIPAMIMLGYEVSFPSLFMWAVAVAFLGVFFAVPLRRQYVEVEKLRFPTGTAAAETILAMYSEAGDAVLKARVLLWSALGAGLFTLAYKFFPQLEEPPLEEWLGWGMLATAAAWGFKLYIGPSLFGAGLLIGPRVVWSLLAGAVLGWAILGPIAQSQGWAPGENMSYADGAKGWILWPGVAIMVCESLMALALSWRTFVRTFTTKTSLGEAAADPEAIPNSWWIGGLMAGSIVTIILADYTFNIPWYLTIVAIPLSAVLASVAVRSLGETDINPVGGVGKVTQLVFGGIAPGQMDINLMAAAITGGGASQAADMMQDLKTGHLLGASPRKQLVAQLIGNCAGVLFAVPAYWLITSGYELGGSDIPAPAAQAWKAMAELLADGLGALPPMAPQALLIAACVGAILPLLRRSAALRPYIPNGLALGIAFIIPPYYSLVMFYGLVAWYIWRWINPAALEKLSYAVAAGLIAGEGLMGIVNAALTILGVKPLT